MTDQQPTTPDQRTASSGGPPRPAPPPLPIGTSRDRRLPLGGDIPRKAFTERVARDVIRRQFAYSMTGLGVGLAAMLLGLVLLLHGALGSTGWVVQVLGLKSSLSDAAPGVVLAVVGLLVVFLTRFQIRVR